MRTIIRSITDHVVLVALSAATFYSAAGGSAEPQSHAAAGMARSR